MPALPSDPPNDPDAPAPSGDDVAFRLPHPEIDDLITRLESDDDAGPGDAHRLLRLVAREAERLHTLSVRLTNDRLSRAYSEASAIVAEAVAQAETLRAMSLRMVEDRLEESERLISALRAGFAVEQRAARAEAAATRGATP